MFRRRGYGVLTSRARCFPICDADGARSRSENLIESARLRNTVTAPIVIPAYQGEMAVFMSFRISAALKARL
jgi:hypothetical protein